LERTPSFLVEVAITVFKCSASLQQQDTRSFKQRGLVMRSSKQVTQRRAKTDRAASFARRPTASVKQAIQPRAQTDRAASFARRPTGRAQHQPELVIRQDSDDAVIQTISEAIQHMGFALDDASVAINYHIYNPEPEKSAGPLARAKENLTYAIEMIDSAVAQGVRR
jgi:hypothetical protein